MMKRRTSGEETIPPLRTEQVRPQRGEAGTKPPPGVHKVEGDATMAAEKNVSETEVPAHPAEELFRKVFNASPMSLGLCTAEEGRFLDVNEQFLHLLGFRRDEVIGRTDLELAMWADPGVRARLFHMLAARQTVQDFECQVCTRTGERRDALISLQRVEAHRDSCLLFITQDVTERVKLEKQRRHSEKMEAVGHLAAGFAHDFNNILTVVQGHTSLLLVSSNLDAQSNRSLQQVSFAAERAATLTRQLLTFSRKQVMRPRALDLNQVIQGLADRLQGLLGENIRLKLDLAPELPAIHADNGMMEQIFLNLGLNAREAMPRGGEFSVKTTPVVIDPETARSGSEARSGLFVCVTASDNGCGMDTATLNRVFEPFFTTKDVGKGPGLGLATLYGIVKQHNGWTEVMSRPGDGTTFRIFLPVKEGAASAGQRSSASAAAGPKQRILVVEDEPPLRALVQSILERNGYRVTDAANGIEALRVWEEEHGEFDLLLTDMVMPEGMTGRELAAQLKAKKPALKVIYSSGYTPELLGPGMEGLCDGVNYLQKPYRPQILAQTVRACLEGVDTVKN
jgi:two-component system cell cycle sensor histidine kinase/response regulator CckA